MLFVLFTVGNPLGNIDDVLLIFLRNLNGEQKAITWGFIFTRGRDGETILKPLKLVEDLCVNSLQRRQKWEDRIRALLSKMCLKIKFVPWNRSKISSSGTKRCPGRARRGGNVNVIKDNLNLEHSDFEFGGVWTQPCDTWRAVSHRARTHPHIKVRYTNIRHDQSFH